jgi:pimeloyl-ACP methyl ester carboxylesterase
MMARPDSTSLLPTITVPTLLLVGEEDAVTQPKEMQAMAGTIPDARIEIIAGAGHASNLERPEAFNRAVAAFLREL